MSSEPTGLVYLDMETTGLSDRAQAFEVAWRPDRPDAAIRSLLLPHTLEYAEPAALEVNRYWERDIPSQYVATAAELNLLRRELAGACVVAANPRFDARFLVTVLGYEPFHYRMLDIESYAAAALGSSVPLGMSTIRNMLVDIGYHIPAPDHTARGDVIALQASHKALVDLRSKALLPARAAVS